MADIHEQVVSVYPEVMIDGEMDAGLKLRQGLD